MTFGELIKSRRNKQKLTQLSLCALINSKAGSTEFGEPLSQATLSAWETDRQKPSESKDWQIDILAEVLKITKSEIEETLLALDQSRAAPAEYRYADELSGWIESLRNKINLKNDRAAIWMVAPDVLPAFIDQSGSILELWKHNIELGVDYFVIWYLKHITYENAFLALHNYLNELTLVLGSDAPGRVEIHLIHEPLSFSDLSYSTQSSFLESYKRYSVDWQAKQHRSRSNITWHAPKIVTSEILTITSEINHWHVPFRGRLAVYLPPFASKVKPCASVLLRDAKRTMHGPNENIYVWLSDDYVEQLRKTLLVFSAWLQSL